MPSKCVPWIVLQVAPSTRTSRRSLRPPKRPSKAKNGQNITFLAISGSVLSDFAFLPSSPLKREKNAAFGSHVALSVLQIDSISRGKSSYQSTTIGSPKPSLFPLPSFFPFFWSILGLKSFNSRQWGILQSISGVSGASGGLRSRNFDFLTKKKFLRKCSYLGNQTSHRVGSGVETTVRPRATRMTIQIKCTTSSYQDRLCFIKHL